MKYIKLVIAALAASCLAFAGAAVAQEPAANAIENLSVAQQGGEVLVKIDLKNPLASPPAGFSVANPARIAFDFPDTANALGRSSQTVNEGSLRSVNIVQVGDRTRLVLNLARGMNYSTRLEGRSLYVALSAIGNAAEAGGQAATRFAEESVVGTRHAIRDISFRRGKEGEARIIVDLSDSGTGIDIHQQGSALVVDFLKTGVPESLRRKLDVTDFATPVTAITTVAQGDNVRMTIAPKGLWEHNAYQSDNQFVVEVKRVVEDPSKLVQGSKIGYQGPRVSINYQNGDVRALLRLMAEELGLNAVISETVSGTTTLVLKDVPADQVIDIIFQQKGLDMRKKGNVILIAPREELSLREKLDYESRQQIGDLEPLVTERFVMNYQKATDIQKLLADPKQPMLSKRGSAVTDTYTNSVFVRDVAAKIEDIRGLLNRIDVPARQVMIEARVVEATDDFNKSLGTRLNFLNSADASQQVGNSGINIGGGRFTTPTRTSSISTSATGVTTVTSNGTPGGQTTPQTFGVNLPSYNPAATTLAFSLFNSSLTRILNLELAALEADGRGKVISSPKVVTANNIPATIEDGYEVPYVVSNCTGGVCTNTVSFKKAKLALTTTPQITPDGKVRMKLEVSKEEPDFSRSIAGVPPIKSSKVDTDVVVENGGTVVIGGVFTTTNSASTERIPFFGDLPYIGFLFKVQNKTDSRRELLVFITPRVVSEQLQLH